MQTWLVQIRRHCVSKKESEKMEREEIEAEIGKQKSNKLEIKTYLSRHFADCLKGLAKPEGKTRSDFVGEAITYYIKQRVN